MKTDDYELYDYFTPPEEGELAVCDTCASKGKRFTVHAGNLEGMKDHLERAHGIKVEVPE